MLLYVLVLAAMVRPPMARLRVVARGAASLHTLEERVNEFASAVSQMLGERCSPENGCLVVKIEWEPSRGESVHDSLSLSLTVTGGDRKQKTRDAPQL